MIDKNKVNPAILDLACDFMYNYTELKGEFKPGDLDKDVSGQDSGDAVKGVFGFQMPWFNHSIFCVALGMLVDDGKILAKRNEKGEWVYSINHG